MGKITYENNAVNSGVSFNKTIPLTEQVDCMCKMVNQSIYQFKRLSFKATLEIRKLLLVIMIFPNLIMLRSIL